MRQVRIVDCTVITLMQPHKTEQEHAVDRFHAHLDQCMQCKHHPFNLCHTGQALLLTTAR